MSRGLGAGEVALEGRLGHTRTQRWGQEMAEPGGPARRAQDYAALRMIGETPRSEEHTSELQSLMRNSYADFCLKKKNTNPASRDVQAHDNPPYTTHDLQRCTVLLTITRHHMRE